MVENHELLSRLQNAQDIGDITELKVGNRCVWPIVRIFSAFRLRESKKTKVTRSWLPRSLKHQLVKISAKRPSEALPNDRIDFLTIGNSTHRTDVVNEKSVNRYTDPVHHFLKGKTGIHLEVNARDQEYPYFTETYSVTPWLEYLRRTNPRSVEMWSDELFGWCAEMRKRWNDPYFSPPHLGYWIDQANAAELLAYRLFDQTMPKAVFLASFYDPVNFGFVKASKVRGIPVVDLQHGVQGEAHFGYTGWSSLPECTQDYLPSHFFHFTKNEAESLKRRMPPDATTHEVMGNSWYNFYQRESPLSGHNSRKRIGLISLGISDVLFDEVLLTAIDHVNVDEWWIRLHPRARHLYSKVFDELGQERLQRCKIKEPSEDNLFEVLSKVRIHLTRQSTVAMEALDFNVPSLLTTNDAIRYYQEWIDKGWMIPCTSPKQLLELDIDALLSETKKMSYAAENAIDWNYLWETLLQHSPSHSQ